MQPTGHPAQLLVVEDDENVARTLLERLAATGFTVTHAPTARAAAQSLDSHSFALALLDVGLPDGDGFGVAQTIRRRSPQTAIVFVTARGNPEERIQGLELGADDYIVKPFHFRELLLRIENVLRRARQLTESAQQGRTAVRIGRATVDFGRFEANVAGETHALTHKECAVLLALVENVGVTVSRDQILDRAWSKDEFPTARTVDNVIVRLRRLVEADPQAPAVIRSVRGVGYLLRETAHD
ncbi:MAG: response regulator transcription factor [Steroidobacteraceae bacterium]